MTVDSASKTALIAAAIGAAVAITVGVSELESFDRASACDLLNIAQQEAQMAEAWHLQAGKVLRSCGVDGAMERAAEKACAARRFNDTSVSCE